jgi:hypothetical protein
MEIDINTKNLRKMVGEKVKYQKKGSGWWVKSTIIEIVNKNIIFDDDSVHFSDIKKIIKSDDE